MVPGIEPIALPCCAKSPTLTWDFKQNLQTPEFVLYSSAGNDFKPGCDFKPEIDMRVGGSVPAPTIFLAASAWASHSPTSAC